MNIQQKFKRSRVSIITALAFGCAVTAGDGNAASGTFGIAVTATIEATCTLSTGMLVLGTDIAVTSREVAEVATACKGDEAPPVTLRQVRVNRSQYTLEALSGRITSSPAKTTTLSSIAPSAKSQLIRAHPVAEGSAEPQLSPDLVIATVSF